METKEILKRNQFIMKTNTKSGSKVLKLKKYMIDYANGSGCACDKLFDSWDDADWHMKTFYSEYEIDGLEIIEVEVNVMKNEA